MMASVIRSGVDLVEIGRLEGKDGPLHQRFLERVFTPGELALTADNTASLAGRFAAKEAVAKALGTGIGLVSWQDIEILRGSMGEPCLLLHGAAERIANELGLSSWSVSISHTAAYAVAYVVAIGEVVQ
jgi:holo-[acyl-carrier protein] synthase